MTEKPKTWIQYDKSLPYIEDKEPYEEPKTHLVKESENSYKVVGKRRPSKMLLVNKLRKSVSKWKNSNYPGVTETTRQLLYYWFEEDHIINNERFNFWFCQREAIETIIYLYEVKKYDDIAPIINEYAENYHTVLFDKVELTEDVEGNRKVIRYFPDLDQEGEQRLPVKNLIRYAFKMATGSGKTFVMCLIIVWSYFNKKYEKSTRYSNNFLLIAPNVIVYERLARDFMDSKIFYNYPFIPEQWHKDWNITITSRGDNSPLPPNGNLILNNIQQLYKSRIDEFEPSNIIEDILGKKPQKDLTKPAEILLERIYKLNDLIVMNDEAHHVHNVKLQWHRTLTSINNELKNGLALWCDFSATPKTQSGTYYPWIIVDYPLAQAVEDRIVKAPLIVKSVEKEDPEDITAENVIKKYGDWINIALKRWQEHSKVFSKMDKKPVLFIMVLRNAYADKITEYIRSHGDQYGLENPDEEVMVIHVRKSNKWSESEILKKDLPRLRKLARNIDEPDNPVRIIVSNLMLREGWDVQNVTITLGLRPFSAQSKILPEQAVGRGLRLMHGIGQDKTQTLEVMGTEAFEDFVSELELEGVPINKTDSPPRSITISPEKGRLEYDIEIPKTELSIIRKYKKLGNFDPQKIKSLFSSDILEHARTQKIKMDFMTTQTKIHDENIAMKNIPTGRDQITYITNQVMKKAKLTGCFHQLYPKIEEYILKKCFEKKIKSIENKNLRAHLTDTSIEQGIIDMLAKIIGSLTADTRKFKLKQNTINLSNTSPFLWRRKSCRCNKTVYNFVALYNSYEEAFAKFLDDCSDIVKFAALENSGFRVDYLSSKGAKRYYYPDFVAVQNSDTKIDNWIIETKGRKYSETTRKDKAIKNWCENVTSQTGQKWDYIRIQQKMFEKINKNHRKFSSFLKKINEDFKPKIFK